MQFKAGETNIICTDIKQSLHFYRDVLNFAFVEEEAGAYRLVNDGSYFLLLPFASEGRPSASYCSRAEISFDLLADDLGASFRYLQGHGVRFESEYQEGKPGFFIKDPDGLIIEIVAR